MLAALLVRVESRAPDPLLDRVRLRRPGVAQANLVALALTATTTPPMWLCILHAQDVLGLAPATAGLLFPPFNVAVVAGSLGGPRVVAAVGARRAMAGGLLGVAAGALALLAIAPDAPPLPTLVGGFVLLGAGLGVASVASTLRGTEALDAADQGFASGLLATSAQLGTAFGLALIVPFTAARAAAAAATPPRRSRATSSASCWPRRSRARRRWLSRWYRWVGRERRAAAAPRGVAGSGREAGSVGRGSGAALAFVAPGPFGSRVLGRVNSGH